MPSSASGIDTIKIDTNFEYKYQSINSLNNSERKRKKIRPKLEVE
jgi:hypothetical protein